MSSDRYRRHMNPILESLTAEERRALLAGLAPGPERTAVWTELRLATKRLGTLGLVEWTEQRGADGRILIEMPLHLTPEGVRLAQELARELDA